MNIKNVLLIASFLVSFIFGAYSQYMHLGVSASSDLIFIIAGVVLIFFWYSIDAKENNYKRGYVLSVGVIGLTIIALPYYFFRTRGFKKGLLYTLILLLIVMLWSAMQYAGSLSVYYVFQS